LDGPSTSSHLGSNHPSLQQGLGAREKQMAQLN